MNPFVLLFPFDIFRPNLTTNKWKITHRVKLGETERHSVENIPTPGWIVYILYPTDRSHLIPDSFLPCLVVFLGEFHPDMFFPDLFNSIFPIWMPMLSTNYFKGNLYAESLIYLMQVPLLFIFSKVFQSSHFQAPCFTASHKLQARWVCYSNSIGVNPHFTKGVD